MSVYEELGVTPIINALGTFTRVGGSLMAPEVLDNMRAAAGQFVCLEELQHAAGKIIAQMTGAPAAYVTSGAQAALVLSVAACITRLDARKMDQLPDTTGMRHRVLMARMHRNHYDHAIEAAGGKIVDIGGDTTCDPAEFAKAIDEHTAAILFLPWNEDRLTLPQVVAVARQRNVPVVVDAAGLCDEPANLTRFVREGGDLVCFSGGKYIRGPQSSGFVCGRRDLISAIAWQHLDMDFTPSVWTAPRELLNPEELAFIPRQGIGRGYKAGKEEIVGLLTALRLYWKRDLKAEKAASLQTLKWICEQLHGLKGVTAEIIEPYAPASGFPLARMTVDQTVLGLTGYDFIRALKNGMPRIHPGERELDRGAVVIHPFGLQQGDEQAIVQRVREIVSSQPAK